MKILNRPLLASFRISGYCEWCSLYCSKREPHHLRTRTPELSIRINLIALGGSEKRPDGRRRFSCGCHRLIHNGMIKRSDVLNRVALREKCSPLDITLVMDLFRRLIRPTASELLAGLGELEPGARVVAERALGERKVILKST